MHGVETLIDVDVAVVRLPAISALALVHHGAHVRTGTVDARVRLAVVYISASKAVSLPAALAAARVRARRVNAVGVRVTVVRLGYTLIDIIVAVRVLPSRVAVALELARPHVLARAIFAWTAGAVIDVRAGEDAVALPALLA
jgi:hypothetical protein